MAKWLRLGTRGSPLALAQARLVQAGLAQANGVAEADIGILPIRTSGDAVQDRALAEAGGKGLFTKELDAALLDGAIDVAVHSAKDLPTELPGGLTLAGCLPREDARDVFISRRAASIAELRPGAVVGSASLRREALLRRQRPDLAIVLLRGNVETRLRKLESGTLDATVLALAGLKRLGLAAHATQILEIDDFLPAVGQGAIALTVRSADIGTRALVDPALDRDAGLALACERAFLAVLDGSCRTPIAGYARVQGDEVRFRGLVLRRDGRNACETAFTAVAADAVRRAQDAARDILRRIPADIFSG